MRPADPPASCLKQVARMKHPRLGCGSQDVKGSICDELRTADEHGRRIQDVKGSIYDELRTADEHAHARERAPERTSMCVYEDANLREHGGEVVVVVAVVVVVVVVVVVHCYHKSELDFHAKLDLDPKP